MYRKLIAIFLPLILLLNGCASSHKDITREEIVHAYQEADYEVWFRDYDEPMEYGQIGYIRADHPDGDYIYFSVFETEDQAKDYEQEYYHPIAMGLFLSIYAGEIHIPKWDVYGCYVAQYKNPAYFDVFQELIKSK